MLYKEFEEFQVFGRIYVAREGINAQISVPTHNFEKFVAQLYSHPEFANVDLKIAVEDDGKSCLLYTSPSPRDRTRSRMPSSA